jgi:UrcA family protein
MRVAADRRRAHLRTAYPTDGSEAPTMNGTFGTGTRSVFACVALLAATAASAGSAPVVEHPDGRRSVAIRVDDLDARSEAGARALYSRLRHASRQVCGTADRDLERAMLYRDCRERAIHDAVLALNEPRVKALHAAKTGGRAPADVRLSAVR